MYYETNLLRIKAIAGLLDKIIEEAGAASLDERPTGCSGIFTRILFSNAN